MANSPISFDDIPDQAPPGAAPAPAPAPVHQGPMSFDDIPDQSPVPNAAPQAPTPTAAVPQGSPLSFDSMPNHAPAPSSVPTASSPAPTSAPQGQAPIPNNPAAVASYMQSHPATSFSLEASPIAPAQLAKAGTVGISEDISDKMREANSLKDAAVGFFNARVQQYFLDPEFIKLSKADQDAIIESQVAQWEQAGLPAGKFNPANPNAWMGDEKGHNSLRQAIKNYADDIRIKGIAGAKAPGGIFDGKQLAIQQVPSATQTAALEFTRGIPGLFGSNIGGELGAAAGELTGLPGGAIVGGVGGSLLGAFGGEHLVRGAIDEYGGEPVRNAVEQLDTLTNLGEQEHPLAAWVGQMGGQFAHNQAGFQQILRGKGLSAALSPRLAGGFIGGGVEAASEAGRGEDLSGYKIGQAALSGTIFTKPRYLGEGPVPMSYAGRNWVDTNVPKPELYAQVDGLLRSGSSPADVLAKLKESVPDTPENRRALRIVSADIRAGRDPAQSLENVKFRPAGLDVTRTAEVVNDHIQDWADAPKFNIHDSYDSETIPADMQGKVGPGTLGWKDANGEIHIVASQHTNPDAVTATIYHEGMHAGLVRAYQTGLEDKLVHVYDSANPNLRTALKKMEVQQQKDAPEDWAKLSVEERKALVVDEVLASTSENGIYRQDFDKVASFIRGFGRAHLGELGRRIKYSDAEIRQIMSTGYDAVSKGSGDALGPVRYMNFGVKAETADTDSLDSYNGKVPDTPEYQQGWFKGPADGQPRYEVSDKDAEFKASDEPLTFSEKMFGRKPPKLDEVLHHPALFAAYPHLRDITVRGVDDRKINGSWSPAERTIYISSHNKEPMGTMLHEIQHIIQDHEGWARGANDQAVYRTAPTEDIYKVVEEQIIKSQDRADKAAEEYHELAASKDDPEWNTLRELYSRWQALEKADSQDPKALEAYRAFKAAKNEHMKSKGVDNVWDPSYADMLYKAAQSSHPVDWHMERARESWERNLENVKKLIDASYDEFKARAAVRYNGEMSEKLYYRAGGEYEARAASARQKMTDDERLEDPQFTKTDKNGVHPDNLYEPMKVLDPNSEVADKPAYTQDDIAWEAEMARMEQEKRQRRQVDENLRARQKEKIEDTRFSRKYSGSFAKDYDGRQARTEDLLKNHFGNFSINNVKGMMRPLEEYQRVSHEEILAAGQELKDQGFDAGLAVAQGAIPDNSGFVVALRDLVRTKLETASEVAGRYRKSGGMRHERELMRAVTDLGQVMAVFDKTASNLGRMLHALRLRMDSTKSDDDLSNMLGQVRFANGQLDPIALDQIAQALISRDPTAIRKSIDRFDPKWKQYGQSLFYNFILGSKAVQLGNIMGNATHIVQKSLQDFVGYGIGKVQDGVYRVGDKLGLDVKAPDRMHFDELVNRYGGILAGLMNKETYNSHRAFQTMAEEFLVPAGQSQHVNKFASQSIQNLPLSLVLEYGTRGLQATDAFFRTVIEHSAAQGLATREARRLNGGKVPTTGMIADVLASPSREMLAKIAHEADRITFQEQPFGTAERFSRFMRGVPGGWLIAPIIRTPSNIGRTAFETFDPTGRITQRNRQALKEGGVEANRVRAGQMMAGALWAGALYLMSEGMLNGGGPANPGARAQWLMSHVPYSIGNKETGFYPLRGISPVGDGLSMIADMRDAHKYGSRDKEMSAADKAMMVAAGMSDAYLSNSFLSSVTDGLERGVQPTMENLLGTLAQSAVSVPLYSQIQKERDPFVRDTSSEKNIASTLANKASLMDNPAAAHYFKGMKEREELPIRRDPFGAPIMADHPTSTDKVAQEVGRLVDSTGKSVVPAFSRTIKGARVPNDLYNAFLTTAGPVMREAVSQIMNDPVYQKALTDEQRAAIIRSNKTLKGLHERLNRQLQQMMLDRNPKFEGNYIPDDIKTLSTLPGE